MSAPSQNKGGLDPKAWIQELKSNWKTQVALVCLVLVSAYLLWPEDNSRRVVRSSSPNRSVLVPLDARQLDSLQKLKDLSELDRAGELPTEGRMYRDLFLFDMPAPPPPPPPKPLPPAPPPPPPTPEQIAAAQLAQARQEATNSRPQSLHYLGYMGRPSTGRIGSFQKGDEILSLRLGDLANPTWKLTALTESYAEFESVKFPDIHFRTEARDNQGPAASTTNQF
jgi:type IV secretory pathway VirB10-like protein